MTKLTRATRTALEVPRWALQFHRRHLLLITALSLLPSTQRLVSQLWGARLPAGLAIAAEVLTETVRLVVIIVVARLAILAEPSPPGGRRRAARAFVRDHGSSLLVQAGLLVAVSAVSAGFLGWIVPGWMPAGYEHVYRGALLFVKNLTIIPFTMIWTVGIVRQLVSYDGGGRRPEQTPPAVLTAPRG